MSLHYRTIVPACCSDSDLAKHASKVVQVEKGKGVVVDMEVDVVRLEISCMGASNPTMVYSIEVVEENMAEMIDWKVGNDIEVKMTKEKVWTMKDKQQDTKGEWMHSGQGCNMNRTPLACHVGMVEDLKDSFG